MIVCVLLPALPLVVALRQARRPSDAVAALGPLPGDPQLVGTPTDAARSRGVVAGLRVGEALARCPQLEIVPPDPAAVARQHELMLVGLERLGAAPEPGPDGVAFFDARGLVRLYGGLGGVITRTRATLPVGLGGRVGAAPSRFGALQAAHAASARAPRVVQPHELEDFLAPLPVDRLPLEPRTVAGLDALGIRTVGDVAALSQRHALERLGFAEVRSWRVARGGDDRALRPRTPPDVLSAHLGFSDPIGSLPALQSALRLLLADLAASARGRGTSLRSVTVRALLDGDGSCSHAVTLREATCDPQRLALACLGGLERITAPVTALVVSGDASGPPSHGQLSVLDMRGDERRSRVHAALGQVRVRLGDEALMRAVELQPWSRLPEHRWALVPFDTSPLRDPSA